MSVRTVVVNADAIWQFASYVRTFALDTYRQDVEIDYWTLCETNAQAEVRPFWGYWPLDASRDSSPLNEDLLAYLQDLGAGREERLAVLVVMELADLKRLAEGQRPLSDAGQAALDVIRDLFKMIDEEIGGAENTVAAVRTKLWVTLVIREGGALTESREVAEKAIAAAFPQEESAKIQTCFFLSESPAEERSPSAPETHFYKLRALIDIMSQGDTDGSDRNGDMWRQLRTVRRKSWRPDAIPVPGQATSEHKKINVWRLVLDRSRRERPWTASDVLRGCLLQWQKSQVEISSNIDDQVKGLNDSIAALLKVVSDQPKAADMEAYLKENPGILNELARFSKPDSIDPDNWPKHSGLLRYRAERLETLEQTYDTFVRDLEGLHKSYLGALPDFVDKERDKNKTERAKVTENMHLLETGLSNAVKETADACSAKIQQRRKKYLNAAAEVRQMVRDKFIRKSVDELGEDLVQNSRLTDFGNHAEFHAAYQATLGRAKRLSMLNHCLAASAIAIFSFLIMSWLYGFFITPDQMNPSNWIEILTLQNHKGQFYLAGAMAVASLLAFLVATWWYSRDFHRAYARMKTEAYDFAKSVEELPIRAFQYGSMTGQASQLSVIDTQLRDLSSMRTAALFGDGFRSLMAGRMPSESTMPEQARALQTRVEQDSISALSTGALYERVRNMLADAPIGDPTGTVSLQISGNRNGEQFSVQSTNIYTDSLRVEPMPEA